MTGTETAPRATVAVIIRTKNRPVLLARALDSVLSQRYDDWTALVLNDAGDRETVEAAVAAVAERARGRLHVLHNEVSAGREAAMNTGVHATDSTYVVIHDDDDTWEPSFLDRTVAYLDTHGVAGVATRTAVVFERIDDDGITVERTEILARDKHDVTLLDVIGRNHAPPISLLYRRSLHDDVGDYDGTLPVLADWEFLIRVLSRFDVGFIDGEPLAFWHHRPAATGDQGNSVVAAHDDHLRWDAKIRDRYLRAELERHGGLGYLMWLSEVMGRDRARDEGQYAHVTHLLDRLVSDDTGDALVGGIAALNRNLVVQNNRLVAQIQMLGERVEGLERLVRSRSPRERLRSYRRAAADRLQHGVRQ